MSAVTKSGPPAALAKRPLSRELALKAAVRLIVLAVMIAAAFYLLTGDALTSGGPKVPTLLLLATAICLVLIAAATLVNQLFEGPLARPLSDALLLLALISFPALLLHLWLDAPSEGSALAVLVMAVGGLLALHVLVKARSERGGLVLRAVILVAAAVLVPVTVPAELLGLDQTGFRTAACAGLLVVAVLSLLPLLRRHRDLRIKAAGRLFVNGTLIGGAACGVLLLSFYIAALRPVVRDDFPDQLVPAEWTVLGAVMAIGIVMLRSYLQKQGGEEETGDLRRHVQAIEGFKPGLRQAAAAVDGFIAQGRKQELVELMTAVLRADGVSEPEIAGIVGTVAGYRAPAASRRDRDAEARRDREGLVRDMLVRAEAARPAEHLMKGGDHAVPAHG